MRNDFVIVFGRTLGAEKIGDFIDIFVRGPGALNTFGTVASAFSREEHVAFAEEFLGAGKVENDARVHGSQDAESDTGRNVTFDETGDDFDDWFLGCEDEVHTGGTTKLSDTDDEGLEFFRGLHHEVGHFVDNDNNVGHFVGGLVGFVGGFVSGGAGCGWFFGHFLIVIGNGFNAFVGH